MCSPFLEHGRATSQHDFRVQIVADNNTVTLHEVWREMSYSCALRIFGSWSCLSDKEVELQFVLWGTVSWMPLVPHSYKLSVGHAVVLSVRRDAVIFEVSSPFRSTM